MCVWIDGLCLLAWITMVLSVDNTILELAIFLRHGHMCRWDASGIWIRMWINVLHKNDTLK